MPTATMAEPDPIGDKNRQFIAESRARMRAAADAELGGSEATDALIQWAQTNLTPEQQAHWHSRVNRPGESLRAVQDLDALRRGDRPAPATTREEAQALLRKSCDGNDNPGRAIAMDRLRVTPRHLISDPIR